MTLTTLFKKELPTISGWLVVTLLFVFSTLISNIALADDHAEKSQATTPETKKMVTIKTSVGDIELSLNAEKAPETVKNFIAYANAEHYNGTVFHRVIKNFMIQGGGFEPGLQQKSTNAPVMNEANNGLKNDKYTIAMARTQDPHSATAQFFINTKDNDFLNFSSETISGWGYTVFGEVTAGQDVIDAIEGVATGQVGPYGDVPKEDIIIESVVVSE